MKITRTKLLALLLSMCMLASLLVVPAGAAKFSDVPDWAAKAVDRWTEAGIMEGNADGTFEPTHKLTRAEFAIILCKLMGYTKKSDPSTFIDLPEDTKAADALLKLHAAGVMVGVGGDRADPDGALTREHVAVMMFRALKMKPDPNVPAMSFSDADQVSRWARTELATLASLGLIRGVGNNTLAPKNDIPKQDMAALLDMMIAAYVTEDGATVDTSNATNPNGVVIIKSGNVTVANATKSSIVITEDAPKNATVTVNSNANDILVSAEGAHVIISENTEVGNVVLDAPDIDVTVDGTVADVIVSEGAEGTGSTTPAESKDADVVEAPMADRAAASKAIASKDLGTVTVTGKTSDNGKTVDVTITGRDIMAHTNAASPGVNGHWVGFGMPAAPKGTTYSYSVGETGEVTSYVAARTYRASNGDTYDTVYFSCDTEDAFKDAVCTVTVKDGDDTVATYTVSFDVTFWKAQASIQATLDSSFSTYSQYLIGSDSVGGKAVVDDLTLTFSGEIDVSRLDSNRTTAAKEYTYYTFVLTAADKKLIKTADSGPDGIFDDLRNPMVCAVKIYDAEEGAMISDTTHQFQLKDAAGRVQDIVTVTITNECTDKNAAAPDPAPEV